MALTDEQRARHHLYVGSSMISKIVGAHPRENIADAFLYATRRVENGRESSDANRGVALEGYVLDMFEKETEIKLARHIELLSEIGEDGRGFCANLDAAITVEREVGTAKGGYPEIEAPVEAKTSNDPAAHAYDSVPVHVEVQVNWQIMHVGPHCRYGLVPVWLANFGRFKFQILRVERNDALIEELRYAGFDFLDHVRRDVMPEGVAPHLETLKRVRREPSSIVSLGDDADEAWGAYQDAKKEAAHWNTTADQRKAVVLGFLGDAEGGRLPCGDTITFMSQNSARQIDLDVLQFRAPELYAEMVSQPTHRVLRRAKAKTKRRR